MRQPLRIAMLLTEAFGGEGGIAKFNRDFLNAVSGQGRDRSIDIEVLPRVAVREAPPRTVRYDRGAASNMLSYLWRTARLAVGPGRLDIVICGHINLLAPAWALARIKSARLVLIVHGYEAWTAPRRLFVRRLAAWIDGLIAVSRLTATRFWQWSGLGLESTFILPNGVDLDRFAPAARDGALAARYGLGGGPLLMTFGRMVAHERINGVDKGFDRLIDLLPRLLSRVRGLRCLIVGDGDDRRRLEAKAAALGLGGCVIFTGAIDEADKPGLYNLADAFVLPSLGEGFGIVLIEAAACGLSVVGSSRDGSREALLGGALGRLVDPNDDRALLDAIVAALRDGKQPVRHAGIEQLSTAAFERRVAAWLGTMEERASHEPA